VKLTLSALLVSVFLFSSISYSAKKSTQPLHAEDLKTGTLKRIDEQLSVRFLDLTSEQTFTHKYTGGWEHFVGGGVAIFDCNNDSAPDIYVAGGESKAKLLINNNKSRISFTHELNSITDFKSVTGAYPIDIDSDGITDLAVLRAGENILLKGLGNCQFKNANVEWKYITSDRWTTAFSATWEKTETSIQVNGPTLVFGNYVDRKNKEGPFGACDEHELYRMKSGVFTNPSLLSPGYCTLSILFSDWQHQGKADLRISNDRHYYLNDGHEQMWKMQEQPKLYTEAEGWKYFKIWGMGIASRDINGAFQIIY